MTGKQTGDQMEHQAWQLPALQHIRHVCEDVAVKQLVCVSQDAKRGKHFDQR